MRTREIFGGMIEVDFDRPLNERETQEVFFITGYRRGSVMIFRGNDLVACRIHKCDLLDMKRILRDA